MYNSNLEIYITQLRSYNNLYNRYLILCNTNLDVNM